ncbi:MAG: dTMP kinase [Archaeoglobaceae archaeon]|nr:dTMP kinase [Archaeoglobaceae archaeon]MDK2875846.1 dTMP kinase [Archaeoglobaceae archaeon]
MRFIVVDGLDGSGKDTHARFVAERYLSRGETVIIRNHPSDSFFGKKAKQSLLGRGKLNHLKASIFYFLDVMNSLIKFYKKADNVIFVRYIGGVFYLPSPLAKFFYKFFSAILPTSNYMFFLDAEPEVLAKRVGIREEKEMFENLEDLKKVRDKALRILKGWHVVRTDREIEETRAEIESILNELDSKN